MLKSEQLDRLMVLQRPVAVQKVESKYLEAKNLDFSYICKPEETLGDLDDEPKVLY